MSYKEPLATTADYGIVRVGDGLSVVDGTVSYGPAFYGFFTDSTTQTNPVINTANTAIFDTTNSANGISIVGGTDITFANAGVYSISMNMQLNKTDGGVDNISIWLAQNGINLSNTNILISLNDNTPGGGLRAGIFLVAVSDGDVVQVKWASADIAMRFVATPAGVAPITPATPSIKIVVTQT